MYVNWLGRRIQFHRVGGVYRFYQGRFCFELRQRWGWEASCQQSGVPLLGATGDTPALALASLRCQMLNMFKAFGVVLDYDVEA